MPYTFDLDAPCCRPPVIALIGACLFLSVGCGGAESTLAVTVSGVVRNAATLMPAAGATVDLVGAEQVAQAGADGVYAFETQPGELVWIRATVPGSIPVRRPLLVPDLGAVDFVIDVLPRGLADGAYAALSLPARDEGKGIVAVHFLNRSMDGREGVAIDLDHDGPFSFDGDQRPAITDTLLPGLYDGLIFSNVTSGQVTSVMHSGVACELLNLSLPSGPVVADELTRIDYDCSPRQ
jgi:hypothetical protein